MAVLIWNIFLAQFSFVISWGIDVIHENALDMIALFKTSAGFDEVVKLTLKPNIKKKWQLINVSIPIRNHKKLGLDLHEGLECFTVINFNFLFPGKSEDNTVDTPPSTKFLKKEGGVSRGKFFY